VILPIHHLGGFGEKSHELSPLLVNLRLTYPVGESFETTQRGDLMLQLRECARTSRLVDELLLQFLDLSTFEILDVVVQVFIRIIELDP